MEYWEQDYEDIEGEFDGQIVNHDVSQLTSSPPEDNDVNAFVWWTVAFLSLFQSLHVISDKAIAWLIKFIATLLNYCAQFSPRLRYAANAFPQSLHLRNKYLFSDTSFSRNYVVCPSCHCLYDYKDLHEWRGTHAMIKTCPSRQLSSGRCNSDLLKKVYTSTGQLKLYPFKVFCYGNLIDSLQRFLLRPGFAVSCETTRNLYKETNGMLSDLYNGKIWHEFLRVDDVNFLSAAYTYGLMLNIDWFEPFNGCVYAVGVLYLAIMNLPRSERYKRHNILILGIIPGPSEPPLTVNTYLSPLVTELLQLWKGVPMMVSNSGEHVVRAALLAVACDLPAGRKVCEFLSHSANFGCSRCYCSFSTGGLQRNYACHDRDTWRMRNNDQHRQDVSKLMQCKTQAEKTKAESQLGCRFSVLLDLPYFDPVRMLVIDPMHNLFLGSAKYFTHKILINTGVLNSSKLKIVNKRLESLNIPYNIGRLPTKIGTGATFTAHQWMNWTLYLSIYCLHGLIPQSHLECWRSFVLACRSLCGRSITENDVKVADLLLVKFCSRVHQLFGHDFVTPNMQLHNHLASCVRDFGPIHAFWLYALERYNGLLGNLPHNNQAIEIQLMQRFKRDNCSLDLISQGNSKHLFEEFGEVVLGHAKHFYSIEEREILDENCFTFPPRYRLTLLDTSLIEELKRVYSSLYRHYSEFFSGNNPFPETCRKYEYIQINGRKLPSSTEDHPTYVMAKPFFTFPSSPGDDYRPTEVQYFIKHAFCLPDSDTSHAHTFMICKWAQNHPQYQRMGKPMQICCKSLYETTDLNRIVPLSCITKQVIFTNESIDSESVLALCNN